MMRKLMSVLLMIVCIMPFGNMVYAADSMSVEEAKDYLENYCVTKVNSQGKEYTMQFDFSSEEELEAAALFIAENGVTRFHELLDVGIEELGNSGVSGIPIQPRTTTPTIAYRTVYGNGRHNISGEANGLASFDSLGTLEYAVRLAYTAVAADGAFIDVTNISFDVIAMGANGGINNLTFNDHHIGSDCGVTANYVISKTTSVGVGDLNVPIKTEIDSETFTILTSLG